MVHTATAQRADLDVGEPQGRSCSRRSRIMAESIPEGAVTMRSQDAAKRRARTSDVVERLDVDQMDDRGESQTVADRIIRTTATCSTSRVCGIRVRDPRRHVSCDVLPDQPDRVPVSLNLAEQLPADHRMAVEERRIVEERPPLEQGASVRAEAGQD